MTARQSGVVLSDLLDDFRKRSHDDSSIYIILKTNAIGAYDFPVYDDPEMLAMALTEFQNTVEVQCYKNFAQ